MAKFFVGQKVKIVSVDGCSERNYLLGLEGVVNEIDCRWNSVIGEVGGGVGLTLLGEDDWAFGEWQLEPILPEGAKPSEFTFSELMDNLGVVVA